MGNASSTQGTEAPKRASAAGCLIPFILTAVAAVLVPLSIFELAEHIPLVGRVASLGWILALPVVFGVLVPSFIVVVLRANRLLEQYLAQAFGQLGLRGAFKGNYGSFLGELRGRDAGSMILGATQYRRSSLALHVSSPLTARLVLTDPKIVERILPKQ